MPLDADPDGRSSATAATTANPARALTHLCKGVGEVVILAQPLPTPSPAPAPLRESGLFWGYTMREERSWKGAGREGCNGEGR